jgi:putative ubiquitin-RnfH superfamily antitoxin RatB of RatAB toxin-antitoxin module
MKVSVAYAHPGKLFLVTLDLPDGATAGQAIEKSGVLAKYPDIDLAQQKVGVYGKVTPLDAPLYEGARLEIYRPIIADPKTVKRRDAAPEKPN